MQFEVSRFIEFDLSWENSWRNGTNWDAAWVFVKYREVGGDWQHVWLNASDANHGPGAGATINIGTTDIGDPATPRGMGAFIYRSEDGTGNFFATGNRLRWEFADQGLAATTPVEIRIFAIEMVYVAEGSFSVGDGTTTLVQGQFRDAASNVALEISSEGQLTLGGTAAGNLTNNPTSGSLLSDFSDTTTETLPAAYPKGFAAFYMMKYSITQQQYVDFLNTLTYNQQDERINGSPDAAAGTFTNNEHRHAIKIKTQGTASTTPAEYETDHPFVANNYMSWMDGAAYMDWAGLRPMTELEFEKAARGPATPVANEYAWGSTAITQATGLTNAGDAAEVPIPTGANANYWDNGSPIDGPVRVGSFAQAATNREQSGSSYWGIMELSGNLWERSVTVGNPTGRSFTGFHGDGVLSANGHANVVAWPGLDGGELIGATGSGFRGGDWSGNGSFARVSGRNFATFEVSSRPRTSGFRGVRSAPDF